MRRARALVAAVALVAAGCGDDTGGGGQAPPPRFDDAGRTPVKFGYKIDTHNVRLNGVWYGCIIYEGENGAGDMKCFPAPTGEPAGPPAPTSTTTTTWG